MKKCLFCSVIKNNKPYHEIIWQDSKHIAFLDKYPTRNGHILIIPKKHVDYLFDLTEKDYTALLKVARKIALRLKKLSNAKRIYLFIKGFRIPHAHVHLIPVRRGKEAGHLPRKKTTVKELSNIALKLRNLIAE